MTDQLQLFGNSCRIQRESKTGDFGDNSNVLECRLTQAGITRDTAGTHSRKDAFRTQEFYDVIHAAWEIEIRGELRSGGFVRWLLSHICSPAGLERGLDVLELPYDTGDIPTFSIQIDGIERGQSTFGGAALKRLVINLKGRRAATYTARFVVLKRVESEPLWETNSKEGGEILTTRGARISVANDFGGDPTQHHVTAYEADIEIGFPDIEPAQFDEFGNAQGFNRAGNYDLVGRLLMPETEGITDSALSAKWDGNISIQAGASEGTGSRFEIETEITGIIDRRNSISKDWKQCQMDFISRRSGRKNIARILTDQPTL